MHKKLYRSREHRLLMGLCGGVGKYFDIDPNLIRLAYVVMTVLTGVFPGVIAYLLGALIVPNEPIVQHEETVILDDDNEPTEI
ncbi:MAG TPA: PspC domain-containing protein [Candidatus Paceibacterota bacterium]|nr:PspC domain-containing protein [Candidatus Paceibacterota bacterium]